MNCFGLYNQLLYRNSAPLKEGLLLDQAVKGTLRVFLQRVFNHLRVQSLGCLLNNYEVVPISSRRHVKII